MPSCRFACALDLSFRILSAMPGRAKPARGPPNLLGWRSAVRLKWVQAIRKCGGARIPQARPGREAKRPAARGRAIDDLLHREDGDLQQREPGRQPRPRLLTGRAPW